VRSAGPEPVTAACITKVDNKAILTIDKACGPECFGGTTCGTTRAHVERRDPAVRL
jgi:hypothetical protein